MILDLTVRQAKESQKMKQLLNKHIGRDYLQASLHVELYTRYRGWFNGQDPVHHVLDIFILSLYHDEAVRCIKDKHVTIKKKEDIAII